MHRGNITMTLTILFLFGIVVVPSATMVATPIKGCAPDAEQELYAVSCDFVFESLHDLEASTASDPKDTDKHKQQKRLGDFDTTGFEFAQAVRDGKYGTEVPFYPFSPYNVNVTIADSELRKKKKTDRFDRILNGLSTKVQGLFKMLMAKKNDI